MSFIVKKHKIIKKLILGKFEFKINKIQKHG